MRGKGRHVLWVTRESHRDVRIADETYGFGFWTFCPSPAPPKLLILETRLLFSEIGENSGVGRVVGRGVGFGSRAAGW
jgi:hypothetical protein